MVPDKKHVEEASQADVDAENCRNRGFIADAIRQMVLLVISLGFTNAFGILLAKPDNDPEAAIPHLFCRACVAAFREACGAPAGSCTAVTWPSFLIFSIYILFGTRFLLTSWLYLSTTYRDEDNPRRLRILPDAIGIFLTGVVIGLQSYYASVAFMSDFFLMVCLVLFVDVVSSAASIAVNRKAVEREGLRRELLWVANNMLCGVAMFILVLKYLHYGQLNWSVSLLVFLAFLNSLLSFLITYFGYFRAKRVGPITSALSKRTP
jgi:hypothetical protein